ncbi:MAG: cardiolipin synthase [Neisseria zoodegmatis]|uniref:cardiolipin synthase n=1 Tax=Neisseria zoodegmatis TaxID=326523 RepID=UPI0026F00D1B|nr:cardiolipin synthase [Neisseria zoodegmatis]MDO5068648.1 cardiolipin synthase [Neisseria zoodegmatis]
MNIEITWGQMLIYLHTAVALGFMVRVLYKQRNTGTAFAWLIMLFLFPLLGVAAYLMLGEPRLGIARAKRAEEMNRFYSGFAERYLADMDLDTTDEVSPRYRGIAKVAADPTGLGVTKNNAISLLSTTDEILAAMKADIEAATQSCLLAFYIIDPQGRIEELLDTVIEAAERGVDCVILADAVGSRSFFNSAWVEKLQNAGVEVHAALPVGPLRTLFTRSDLRNHRKLLIIDKKIGYTGSYNLVDPHFFKKSSGVGEWVDVMMRCIGPMVLEMTAVFYADIAVENDQNLVEIQKYLSGYVEIIPAMMPEKMQAGQVVAQVIPSSPSQNDRVIYETIISAVYAATRKLVITTPYFVPDDSLLMALTNAAKRGVDVTLILPAKVDSIMVRYASQAYYPMLLRSGVKIALFDGGLLHAKTMTVDDGYTLFGTVNMDMRSFFLNLEISLAVYDKGITRQVWNLQKQYLAGSSYVSIKNWQQRAKWWGLVENAVRLMSPLL